MNANRPLRRMLHVVSAASFVVGAVVCAIVLLYANLRGVPRVAAGLVFGSLVVAFADGKYLERRAASRSPEGSRLDTLQPRVLTPGLPPRQTSDDYRYPAAATRDRTGTGLGGARRDPAVARLHTAFESSDAAKQARFEREMERIHRPGGRPG